jgi:hypothetical protein
LYRLTQCQGQAISRVAPVDFRFSEKQELFRKSVRDFPNRELPKSWAQSIRTGIRHDV